MLKFKQIHFEEIDSTNNYLKNNYQHLDDFTFASADYQSQGKGRNNRTWISKAGENLMFSLLIKDDYLMERPTIISLVVAVEVAVILETYGIKKVSIKWPNDVLVGDKKICGILAEGQLPNYLVVGVGLNINNDKFEIINSIIEKFDELLNLDKKELITLYRNYSTIINKDVYYQGLTYKVVDIDLNGHLVLSNLKGKITVSSDEINIKESLLKYENKN